MTMLHVLSAGAAKGLVQGMQGPFSAARGVTFGGAFGAVGAMREKLLAGEPCDLIILTAAIVDALAAQGLVQADTVAALGRVHTGIAVPAGDAHPAIADADGLRRALEGARGIYLPDPERATAGIHFANVLRALGIFDRVRERLRPFPNGAAAMRAMADAGEPGLIGCTQVTEINYTVGVELAGLLPREFELATTYSLAVCTGASAPALAREFAGLLSGPASLAMRVQGGFVVD
ncbi:MAG: substrate-binding domain-containing protein [Burkholderiales bacterium]|nr:substrate-binding domain-containing protein [Betaproteobacteria bacterium]MBP8294708.1 substrate-binding domain-containing protein [Burkholderiales bacterium]